MGLHRCVALVAAVAAATAAALAPPRSTVTTQADDVSTVPFRTAPFASLNATSYSGIVNSTKRPYTAHLGIVQACVAHSAFPATQCARDASESGRNLRSFVKAGRTIRAVTVHGQCKCGIVGGQAHDVLQSLPCFALSAPCRMPPCLRLS